mgnify:CR=1 FL=1
MLYYIFKYLDEAYNLPGSGMFQYISFRAAAAIIIALLIVIVFGRNIINFLRRKQIGEEIRDLGLEGQLQKKGTPTMGGVIILLAILIPVLLFGQLDNVYIQLMLVSTIWLGLIGFLDDYIKVFRHHKEGLKGRFKIVGQVGLGIIVGTTMCFSPDIVVREKTTEPVETIYLDEHGRTIADHIQRRIVSSESRQTTQTTIPFVKDNEFDYSWLTGGNRTLTWILYVVVAILVVTAVSNGANLTDGLDGLVTGVSAPIVLVLGILAYLSGHIVYADYLNIMYIPGSGELVVFAAALAGALVGFLWYNSFPAQIFMGDTGSLSIGGIIAVFALCIRKELLLPLLCGIFLVESLSVMLQVSYFKYTKRKYGEGRRILLMSPLHHHYQKQGFFETKIVTRFWIVSLLLAAWFTDTRLRLRGQGFFKTVIYMPNLIMASAFAMLFFALFSDNGPVNAALVSAGFLEEPFRFLSSVAGTRGLVGLMNFLMWFGNTTILLMAAVMGIDPGLYEAAEIDGCTPGQMFRRITLPLIRPILVYVVITSMIGGLQMFDVPQILTNGKGSPDRCATTMIMYLNNHMYSKNYGMAGAVSTVLFLVCAVLCIAVLKTLDRSQEGGAGK